MYVTLATAMRDMHIPSVASAVLNKYYFKHFDGCRGLVPFRTRASGARIQDMLAEGKPG